MSTTPYSCCSKLDDLNSYDKTCMLNNNSIEQNNTIDDCRILQQQVESCTLFQNNGYFCQYHYQQQCQDTWDMENQNLSKLFDNICIDSNLNNQESVNNFIDFNLFDINDFDYTSNLSILSLMDNSHDLSPLSPSLPPQPSQLQLQPALPILFQSDIHTDTSMEAFLGSHIHQASADDFIQISQDITAAAVSITAVLPMNCPYPPTSMIGLIDEHDRPFAQYGHCDHEMIRRQCQFDLTGIRTGKKRILNSNRMARKMYAITCHTFVHKEHILNEICQQFSMANLQYVCVSTDTDQPTTTTTSSSLIKVYIQIILKKVVNKNGWFLDRITGDECNYHVTDNDLAWNEFIKKGRFIMEIGLFKSMIARSRLCSWSSSPFVRAQQQQ